MASKIHEAGFTLLELLVAISVTLLLVGVMVSGYTSFNETQSVTQAALTFKNNVHAASVNAQAVKKPSSGCTQLTGYTVTFASDRYTIQAQCTEGLVGDIREVRLPSGVTFSPVPSPVTFLALTAKLSSPATVNVSFVGRTKTYQLILAGNGEITDVGY
jgi:prepilin-type N-terminal cleavage/methylation domain-containing protein